MPPFFSHDLKEASATALASTTPDVGTSWTEIYQSGPQELQCVSTGLRSSGNSGDNGAAYTADATYPSANYEAQVTFVTSFSTATPFYLCARIQDIENMYAVRLVLSSGSNNAQLYKKVSGTWSTLGSAVTIADGSVVKLAVNGTAIKVYDDGVEVISVTDSAISAAGKAGLAHGGGAELVNSTDDMRNTVMASDFSVTAISSGISATVNQATETDAAQPITARKSRTVTQVTETNLAQAIARLKRLALGQVTETELAQAITPAKAAVIGQVVETSSAQAITAPGAATVPVNQVAETDSAQAITPRKLLTIGQATEANSAQPMTSRKVLLISQVTETDLAQALFRQKRVSVVQVVEVDAAQALLAIKRRALGQPTETDLAQSIVARKVKVIAMATETDTALPIAPATTIVIGAALRIDKTPVLVVDATHGPSVDRTDRLRNDIL